MTLQSHEVTQGDDEPATTHQAQIRRVIAEEHGAGQVRRAQRSGVLTPVAAAWLAEIATPRKGRELAPHGRGDVLVPMHQLRAVLAGTDPDHL